MEKSQPASVLRRCSKYAVTVSSVIREGVTSGRSLEVARKSESGTRNLENGHQLYSREMSRWAADDPDAGFAVCCRHLGLHTLKCMETPLAVEHATPILHFCHTAALNTRPSLCMFPRKLLFSLWAPGRRDRTPPACSLARASTSCLSMPISSPGTSNHHIIQGQGDELIFKI